MVRAIYQELIANTKMMVPEGTQKSWNNSDTDQRNVCDYIAGMTDAFAERMYRRFHEPGFGSCSDEL